MALKLHGIILIALLLVLNIGSAQPADAAPYEMRSIYFGGGDWRVDPSQQQELYEWIDAIPNLHEYEIVIHSHTDNIGSVEYNKRLSQMRSNTVHQILLDHAIPADWLFIRDYGEGSPQFNNDTYMGRLRNRRVDVILIPPPT